MQFILNAVGYSQQLYAAYCPSVVQTSVECVENQVHSLVDRVIQSAQECFPSLSLHGSKKTAAVAIGALAIANELGVIPQTAQYPLATCALVSGLSLARNPPNTIPLIRQICTGADRSPRLKFLLIQHVFQDVPFAVDAEIQLRRNNALTVEQRDSQLRFLACAEVVLLPTPEEQARIQKLLPPAHRLTHPSVQRELQSLYNQLLQKALAEDPLCKTLRWLQQTCENQKLSLAVRLLLVKNTLGLDADAQSLPEFVAYIQKHRSDSAHQQALRNTLDVLMNKMRTHSLTEEQAEALQKLSSTHNLSDPNLKPVARLFFYNLLTELLQRDLLNQVQRQLSDTFNHHILRELEQIFLPN